MKDARRFLSKPAAALGAAAVLMMHPASGSGQSSGADDLFSPPAIAAVMKKANAWQIAHPAIKGNSRNWERGTWFTGVMGAYLATGDRAYLDQAMRWAGRQQWKPGTEKAGANALACCQTYLELYFIATNRAFIEPTIQWLDSGRPNTPSGARLWYLDNHLRYADSLYVGAPTLAMLAKATGDPRYLDWMNAFFQDVQRALFDEEAGLFYRDKRFIGKQTADGRKVFWSRGNGWVFASLSRILTWLPEEDPHRAQYESLFKQMAAALVQRQPSDGLWRPNLDDPDEFPMPETSGTGFFCYGLAWGVRNGLLDFDTYQPAVKRAWAGLVNSVSPEGKVQWGQPVGDRPAAVARNNSQEYVTGAFLLAGSEVYRLAQDGIFDETTARTAKILASRGGADEGAKPCKWDSLARPSVLVTPQRLARVRREVLRGRGERRTIYQKDIKANADRWLHRRIVIPGVGGWAHDFFCTDGTMLGLPTDQEFNPEVPSRCPVCGKAYLDPKILGARRFFEHYWLAGAARDLALTYAIEQRPEYAHQAAEILLKYADAYPHELGEGGFQGMTLSEAVCLIPLAEAYDLVCDTMTPAQRRHVERDFFWPATQSLTHAGFAGNWGSWHLSAIGVIGYATRHQRFIDFATREFKSQIANQLGDDGLWPESVGTYHFYALDAFLGFAEASANCGQDLYHWSPKPGKSLEAMFEAPLWYAYPNLRLAEINDGWFESWLPADQYTLACHRYGAPEFAWAVRKLRREGESGNPGEFMPRYYRYLLYGKKLPSRIPKPVFTSTNFPVLGIAILRQGSGLPPNREMMMTLHYGPFLGHGHYDKMGVTLFAQGRLLAPDYGTSGYGIGLSRFLQSAPGHNTIVVDGKNQRRTRDRDLVAFTNTPEFKLAAARTSELAPGTIWTRTVMLADEYAVIWDRIDGATEHQYDWFFHAEGKEFSLRHVGKAQSSPDEIKGEFSYPFITDVHNYTLGGLASVARWASDGGGLDLWALSSSNQTAFTGRFPTPEIRRVPLLVLRQKSRQAQFLAVLRPWRGVEEKWRADAVQFHREADGSVLVTVKVGNREDRIHLGNPVDYEQGDAKPISISLTKPHSVLQ
ncbi:MAG: glycoside hydrolase family 88 protein [Verrucomicrobiota bacterium]|nr:glycoside hydrolase family 88 protein [Verrucomicrobiota bacterium]